MLHSFNPAGASSPATLGPWCSIARFKSCLHCSRAQRSSTALKSVNTILSICVLHIPRTTKRKICKPSHHTTLKIHQQRGRRRARTGHPCHTATASVLVALVAASLLLPSSRLLPLPLSPSSSSLLLPEGLGVPQPQRGRESVAPTVAIDRTVHIGSGSCSSCRFSFAFSLRVWYVR